MPHSDTEQNVSSLPFRNHTAQLLATALPYLQPSYRHPVELITKFLEFSETIQLYQEFHGTNQKPVLALLQDSFRTGKEAGLLGLINTFVLDVEGLLSGLSRVCTGKEQEIITMLLNLFRAKSFYENYGDILNTFMSSVPSQETPDAPPPSPQASEAPSGFSMPDMASLFAGGDLTSMMTEEQADTLNLLKNLLDAE